MDAIKMIKERRSIRKYKETIIDDSVFEEIIGTAKYSPSWGNKQIVRYNIIKNINIIKKIANNASLEFVYNIKTLENTKNLVIVSYVKNLSGKLGGTLDCGIEKWSMFDSGIATQTFCLAAYEKGIGTCIFGVFDKEIVKNIINLPDDEEIAALIVCGYPDESVKNISRKEINELIRYIK